MSNARTAYPVCGVSTVGAKLCQVSHVFRPLEPATLVRRSRL